MYAMPAEDVLGAPTEPELDEYGVPVQPPPKAHAYLRLTSSLMSNAIQVAAVFAYLRYEHGDPGPSDLGRSAERS